MWSMIWDILFIILKKQTKKIQPESLSRGTNNKLLSIILIKIFSRWGIFIAE